MDPAVELSVIEVNSFYALMEDTSISENIFLDTEEPQVQPNTSAGTHVYLALFQCIYQNQYCTSHVLRLNSLRLMNE